MLSDAIQSFMQIRETSMMKIKEGKEQGMKVVGKYCTFCPGEMIIAAGAIPVSLCGTKEEPIDAAETILPRNLCPLIKSSFGFAVTDTCPFLHFSDLVIGETTCDGKKKMFEIMGETRRVHVMQLPHQQATVESQQMWAAEMAKLRRFLENELHTTITDAALWEAIDLVNRETAATKAVCDLNQMDPPPLSGMDLLTVTWSRSFAVDNNETIAMLTDLRERVLLNPPERAPGPRILITGCPMGIGTEKLITLTEEAGAHVVALEICSGYKTLELQTAPGGDPVAALAEKYLRIPCSCMSPNPYRLELLTRMIDDFKVDAVIDLTWQACHTYNIEAYDVERMLKARNKPYLHLESDYSTSDLAALKVRIEALLEMI